MVDARRLMWLVREEGEAQGGQSKRGSWSQMFHFLGGAVPSFTLTLARFIHASASITLVPPRPLLLSRPVHPTASYSLLQMQPDHDAAPDLHFRPHPCGKQLLLVPKG